MPPLLIKIPVMEYLILVSILHAIYIKGQRSLSDFKNGNKIAKWQPFLFHDDQPHITVNIIMFASWD
jgi:hypothetical protein